MIDIAYSDAIKQKFIWIDTRTPSEYQESTIPGAFNFPILLDEERVEVSTIYRNESKQKAKALGLEYAQEKLAKYYQEIYALQKEFGKEVLFFCFRGGMRSHSLAQVMSIMGIPSYVLEGGYKAYRKSVLEHIQSIDFYSDKHFVVLHGKTGVGKTTLLQELSQKGFCVLDLEEFAKNKGSIFGSIPFSGKKVNQKMFESLIYETLSGPSKIIFLESESKKVGANIVPDLLFQHMEMAHHVLVDCTMEKRIENILKDYSVNDSTKLLYQSTIMKMDSFSNEQREKLCVSLEENHFEQVVRQLLVQYYDKLYNHSINKYSYELVVQGDNPFAAADKIIEKYGVEL